MRAALPFAFVFVFLGCGGTSPPAQAPSPPGPAAARIELVESAPLETTLDHADVRDAYVVWPEMIDGARVRVDLAEFYASDLSEQDAPRFAGSRLTRTVEALERAIARGVKVRFLADAMFAKTYPDTLDRLARHGAEVRRFDVSASMGGVLHAKYFVVDGERAFLGSQNFDWRSLAHIQEMGVRVEGQAIATPLEAIFERDWLAAGDGTVPESHATPVAVDAQAATGESLLLVASPKGYLPDEARWDLPRLVALIDGAKQTVAVQLLTYKTTSRDGSPFPTLDEALRRAASRGVHVRLLVSHWGAKPGDGLAAITALAKVPNVHVRVLTVPPWSGGEIPFARVAHAKYMIVDDARAWVGTSNWEGDYFTRSRNVGVIAIGGALPKRLAAVFDDGFRGVYAAPLGAEDVRSEDLAAGARPSSSGSAPR